jgi:hypothetical protein
MENENKQTKLNAEAFGISQETADKIRTDILPSVPLGDVAVGESIKLRILSSQPEMISHKQKDAKTKEEVVIQTPVLKVLNHSSGMEETLWLSSSSLRMEMFKISKLLDGDLSDKEIVLKVEEYKHETYGTCRGYRTQIIKSEE